MGEKEREKKIERKADRKRAMSGRKRRIKGWEIEKTTGKRGMVGERKIGRERQPQRGRRRDRGEREREGGKKKKSDRGEREKITNTKKFMEFYLVVLHSPERSQTRQWIVARQVLCYNPLSCFNAVTINKKEKLVAIDLVRVQS